MAATVDHHAHIRSASKDLHGNSDPRAGLAAGKLTLDNTLAHGDPRHSLSHKASEADQAGEGDEEPDCAGPTSIRP
jgi:hypothetical protein